ncbi:MAG: TetR/AcrR family transcriptional regulator [Micavibrio sp.]|nr:TetR/AcrR family transcriptional regulator [Micavibrio sp.]
MRPKIVLQACDEFLKNGYHGTSLSDIALKYILSKATIYHYFPSKAALFETVMEFLMKQWGNAVVAAVGEDSLGERNLLSVRDSVLVVMDQSKIISIERLAIGEAARFPRISNMYDKCVFIPLVEALTTLILNNNRRVPITHSAAREKSRKLAALFLSSRHRSLLNVEPVNGLCTLIEGFG